MSELMNTTRGQADFRRRLLASVSAVTLAALAYAPSAVMADDATDRPTIWVELGGQLEQMQGGQEPFAPSFMAGIPNTFPSPTGAQKPSLFSYGGEGAVLFQPEGSDWVLSASVRYGRSNGEKHRHQMTPNGLVHFNMTSPFTYVRTIYPASHVKFEDLATRQDEAHAILDFQAGKDVGLGIFGHHGSSILSGGIRFTQFTSKSSVDLHMEPDLQYPVPTAPIINVTGFRDWFLAKIHFHDDSLLANSERSFRGVGPSLAWKASAPFVGNSDHGEITLDWGANAAILFGRQKVNGHHQTTILSYYKSAQARNHKNTVIGLYAFGTISVVPHHNTTPINRARTVIVPNLGGFAGLSFQRANAKVSFGYRADFFFGAIDGGVDAAKKENRGFYGPFASVSVGIGG